MALVFGKQNVIFVITYFEALVIIIIINCSEQSILPIVIKLHHQYNLYAYARAAQACHSHPEQEWASLRNAPYAVQPCCRLPKNGRHHSVLPTNAHALHMQLDPDFENQRLPSESMMQIQPRHNYLPNCFDFFFFFSFLSACVFRFSAVDSQRPRNKTERRGSVEIIGASVEILIGCIYIYIY